MQTLYDRLMISRDASPDVIRAAYRALSQRHHPDRHRGDATAARTMQAINDAYAVLSDAERRRAYDATLRGTTPRVSGSGTDQPTSSPPRATARQQGSDARRGPLSRKRMALCALTLVSTLGAGIVLWNGSPRTTTLAPAPAVVHADWRIHGIDAAPREVQARANEVLPATERDAEQPPADPAPPVTRADPARTAPAHAQPATAPQGPRPALPIVADPNGRPWPLGAAYIAGLPQRHLDGLSAVVLDNERNPAPVFVTLVAFDGDSVEPIRHVHVPAMGAFRVESLRPGRYEVHHRNLVTGALTRSEVFDLRQIGGRYGSRGTERTVALDPWSAAMARHAAGAF